MFKRIEEMSKPTAEVMERFPFLGNTMLVSKFSMGKHELKGDYVYLIIYYCVSLLKLSHEMAMCHGIDLGKNLNTVLDAVAQKTIQAVSDRNRNPTQPF